MHPSGHPSNLTPSLQASALRLLPRVGPPPARVLVPAGDPDLVAGLRRRGYDPVPMAVDALMASSTEPVSMCDHAVEVGVFAGLPVRLRDAWVQALAAHLRPGGRLFGVFFEFQGGGPPFGTDAVELGSRFGRAFDVMLLEPSVSSPVEGRRVLEAIFQRR